MSIDYGWEKLHKAIHSLCGQGSQSERLKNAISFNLIQIKSKEHLPEEMRDEFNEFMKRMTSVQSQGNEGTIQATIDSFDELEVSQSIEKIISFYDTICRHSDPF